MLRQRLISGALFISALVAVYLYAPLAWIGVVLLVLTFLGLRETCALFASAGLPAFTTTATVGGTLSLAAAWFYKCGLISGWVALGVPSVAMVGLLTASLRAVPSAEGLRRIAATLAVQMYVPFFMLFLGLILNGWGGEDGRQLAVFFVAMVKATDIGAYFTGCAIGRHKLIPHISPAKTWEGSAGGIALAYAAGAGFYFGCDGVIGPFRMGLVDLAVLPLLMAVSGSIGDLVESMIKRAAQMKDSSKMIAGMGGILDVIDSLLLAAPVFYLYVLARVTAQSGDFALAFLFP